jgi:hypothetical protein
MADSKDLILINPEIGTRDYYPKMDVEGKTFTQIADELHKKYQIFRCNVYKY